MIKWQDVPGWFGEEDAAIWDLIVENTPKGGEIVEVGCWQGRSTCALISLLQKNMPKKILVHCVDTFNGSKEHEGEPALANLQNLFTFNLKATRYPYYEIWPFESVSVAKAFQFGSLDGIFIDGAHDFHSVCDDLAAWLPKVKEGGIIAGHDFNFPEVHKAITAAFGGNPGREILEIKDSTCWYVRV